MQFKKLHPNFQLPVRSSSLAGGYDLFMPTDGRYDGYTDSGDTHSMVGLGFSAAVPVGFVALILPRSGAGAKRGVELRNTVGVIDSDYRGEWMVAVTQKEGDPVDWEAGDRLYQYLLVPVAQFDPVLVEDLPGTDRGEGGFGSTGN
jgi:dUTP pyrophosphatase